MGDLKEEISERMRQLSTPELVRVLTEDAGDYVEEALAIARAELKRRGGRVPDSTDLLEGGEEGIGIDEASAEEIANAYKGRDTKCRDCGGDLRYAGLHSSTEIVLAFADTHEMRYLEVDVCTSCRKVTLRADLETEIDEIL
jgi:hypothetical protein